MSIEDIEQEFRKKVCDQLRLVPEGINRYRVVTPFIFEDGDNLAIVLKGDGNNWLLSDEGHTYMHLTYDIDEKDLQQGTRQKIIENTLTTFSVEDRNGELVYPIRDRQFGDALYNFIQALLKVSDVSFLSRERVHSTFMEDFRAFMEEKVPVDRRIFDWYDRQHDPNGKYVVDCRINGTRRPLFVHALPGDDQVRDGTITLLLFERWGLTFRSLGIFEDQEEITRKVLARYSDVCEKQFSSLATNKDRIAKYLDDVLRGA